MVHLNVSQNRKKKGVEQTFSQHSIYWWYKNSYRKTFFLLSFGNQNPQAHANKMNLATNLS